MIGFLFKGIIRDRSRSLFPALVVITGVALTVILFSWLNGMFYNMIETNANFQTGHVKIMSAAYADQADQLPNDLALTGVDTLIAEISAAFPEIIWAPRIRFGGLLDIPDESGETRSQGPVFGMGLELFKKNSLERDILNLKQALVRGRLPAKPGEVLISDDFSRRLKVEPGQTATLMSATMFGSMSMYNFIVTGTVQFGITALDRGAMIADLGDIQKALDMENAAGEIFGFFDDLYYHEQRAAEMVQVFNDRYHNPNDEFYPEMIALRDQNNLAELIDIVGYAGAIIGSVFLGVMFMVLWNAGLMGSLRRYGEIGVRLAIGEEKGHLFRSMLFESLLISFIGSLIGTGLGLAASYYLQVNGIDVGSLMKNNTMMMSGVLRTKVTASSYYIGFIPGLLAMLFGTAVSGIGIYKRQTSQLFKELEV